MRHDRRASERTSAAFTTNLDRSLRLEIDDPRKWRQRRHTVLSLSSIYTSHTHTSPRCPCIKDKRSCNQQQQKKKKKQQPRHRIITKTMKGNRTRKTLSEVQKHLSTRLCVRPLKSTTFPLKKLHWCVRQSIFLR